MTEKRFYKTSSSIEKYRIYDDDLEEAYFISCDEHTIDTLIELLNDQDQQIKELTNFKNKVFSILDEEIQYKKGLQELSEEQEMDMSLERFTFEHAMLLTIKRKLEEIE